MKKVKRNSTRPIVYCRCFPGFCAVLFTLSCVPPPQCTNSYNVFFSMQLGCCHCCLFFSELYRGFFYAAMLWFVLICKQLRLCISYYFIFSVSTLLMQHSAWVKGSNWLPISVVRSLYLSVTTCSDIFHGLSIRLYRFLMLHCCG